MEPTYHLYHLPLFIMVTQCKCCVNGCLLYLGVSGKNCTWPIGILYWGWVLGIEPRVVYMVRHTIPLCYTRVHHFYKQMLSISGWLANVLCVIPCLGASLEQQTDIGTLLRGEGLKAGLMQRIRTRVKRWSHLSSRQTAVSGSEARMVLKARTGSPDQDSTNLWGSLQILNHQHLPFLFACPIVVGKGCYGGLQELLFSDPRLQWSHHKNSHWLCHLHHSRMPVTSAQDKETD